MAKPTKTKEVMPSRDEGVPKLANNVRQASKKEHIFTRFQRPHLASMAVLCIPCVSNNIQRKELIMNMEKLRFKKTFGLFLVSAFLLGSSLVYAEDMCQIIRIQEGKGAGGSRIEIFPEKITVSVGTCTVWINWINEKEVRVSFRENAKQCILSTEASTGFEELELKTGESCYISEKLPRGKTASLVWTKPGSYKYNLEAPGSSSQKGYIGKIMAEGVIEVK